MAGIAMSHTYERELEVIEQACRDIASSGKLTDTQKNRLAERFADRVKNALELVDKHKVHRYRFRPSGRTIWTVEGRKRIYQVIPETTFCNCDDYYFRVMDGQKALCYHIIAQKIAFALGRFQTSDLKDAQYARITKQWRTTAQTAQ